MCTMGRQGVPSLFTYIRPVVYADATRSFKTISSRRRGDAPYAVAFRREVGLKCSSASFDRSRSTKTFGLAVRSHRIKWRGLVVEFVPCCTVCAA